MKIPAMDTAMQSMKFGVEREGEKQYLAEAAPSGGGVDDLP